MIAEAKIEPVEVRTHLTFPKHRARDLMFETRILPQAFEGELNLVLVAFKMWHQDIVNTWVPFAELWAATDPGFRYYEVPVIQYMLPAYHDFIDRGMARSIRDPLSLQRTITLYTNVPKFLKALNLQTDREAVALLVDQQGRILRMETGAFTQAKSDALLAAVEVAYT